jgi:predicted dehydrogenase
MNPHRILLSGPGLIGLKHADLVSESKLAELVGVVAPNTHQNQAFAREHNIRLYEDFREALAQTKPTATIISSPNNEHYIQAKISLENDVPALVEKPITHDLATAKLLCHLTVETGVPLLVGHHRTHSPLISAAMDFLRSQDFGKLVGLQGSALFYKPADYFSAAPWRSKKGGGPLLINLIHEIGLWRTFGGEIDSVSAIASNRIRNFEVEDSATISLRFKNDALGSFILSDIAASPKSWELTTGENPAFPQNSDVSAYHFAGTRGSLDFPNMKTRTYSGEPSWLLPFEEGSLSVETRNPLKMQLEHFLRVASGLEAPLVSAHDGYKNLVVLSAITRSSELGREIEIDSHESEYIE